jgi:hypothetical protein
MQSRTTRSTVTFGHPFVLPGYPDELPAGAYEVLAEEELLEGLSFEAWRRTATYLTVRGTGLAAGRTELRPVMEKDLETVRRRDPDNETEGGTARQTGSENPK